MDWQATLDYTFPACPFKLKKSFNQTVLSFKAGYISNMGLPNCKPLGVNLVMGIKIVG